MGDQILKINGIEVSTFKVEELRNGRQTLEIR